MSFLLSFKKRILSLLLVAVLALPAGAFAAYMDFSEMYAGASAEGLVFSDKLNELAGSSVTMTGYMAPPLKPSIDFFVLTETPMSVCPFCSTDADWPYNIVVVYVDGSVEALPYDQEVSVTGTLDIGSYVDDNTGFVSQVRLLSASVE
ncbi:MAG: hypothetical protein LKE33_08910 [Acidaminococcus sp.]|jgi:hypothetical protein|nr:hypothetical protein [Acidaminococcus sp.]MCI2099383.1 hypothetical protein [Acidaminococcus sp.]MCI2113743.1 hypothetical protein [Acidaminococcus sp.]MCI2115683.1 hypothetical protein [Acidaminococcus sp.]